MVTRRQILKGILGASIAGSALLLTNCIQTPKEPAPFVTGQALPPPLGCSELREQDARGDC